MKYETKKIIGETARNVGGIMLEAINLVSDIMDSLTITRSDLWNAINGTDYGRKWSKKEFTHSLHNLARNGCIHFNKNNSIQFTNKARLKVIDKVALKRDTDSHFRFISFDIPEQMRKQRDQFRRIIKKLGFKKIQKSLWVINKNVGDLVELAAYEFGVEKYIIYIASNTSDIDGLLDKKFQ